MDQSKNKLFTENKNADVIIADNKSKPDENQDFFICEQNKYLCENTSTENCIDLNKENKQFILKDDDNSYFQNFCDEFSFLKIYKYVINNSDLSDYYKFTCENNYYKFISDFIKIVKIYYSTNQTFENICKEIIKKLLRNENILQLNNNIIHKMFELVLVVIANEYKNPNEILILNITQIYEICNSYISSYINDRKMLSNAKILDYTILNLKKLNKGHNCDENINLVEANNMIAIGKIMADENLFLTNENFYNNTKDLSEKLFNKSYKDFRSEINQFIDNNQKYYKNNINIKNNFIKEVYGLEFLLEGYKKKIDAQMNITRHFLDKSNFDAHIKIIEHILDEYNNININNDNHVFKLITCISILEHIDTKNSKNCKYILNNILRYLHLTK
jgi:hypothetical protein